jgi:hypothetical protein
MLAHPRNPYHENLRTFARRWLDDPLARSRDVLVFELYPWHSDAATAPMAPEVELLEQFVWAPISELRVEEVFAIGVAWRRIAEQLGLPERPLEVAFTDRTRRVRSFALPSGQRLIVTWHQASHAPPNALDVQVLKRALGRLPKQVHAISNASRAHGRGHESQRRLPQRRAALPGTARYGPF